MINVCLCDDSKISLEKYSILLNKIAEQEGYRINISCYSSGEQLTFESENKLRTFDIVYMDMVIGKMNGVQTALALRDAGFEGQIIFLTSSKDYTLQSFDAMPLHYIIKQDTNDSKFAEIFTKAVKLSDRKRDLSFKFESHSKITHVPLDDILYFEVQIRQVFLYTETMKHSFYSQIDVIQKQLSEKQFSRCHRSFVVNLRHIRSISASEITLTNSQKIPVGSKYIKELKRHFSSYLESKSIII